MSEYIPTIGMEIHAELKTKTKMFCRSLNDPFEAEANVNVCPVCLAHPGVLPVINRKAVWHVLRVGAAVRGALADYTEFDRKSYFYPDLPKGYQLSQYEFPLVTGGILNGVAITRVHLEEDTASSLHDEVSGESLIDFNRAGVPLMELVTEPVIHSAKEAGDFARSLQLLLRYLDVSSADMEKGHMRLEANISVRKKSDQTNSILGTKVEVKNINSFRAMERAIEFEVNRQTELLESGADVIQETRGWDDTKQQTFTQRVKEVAADYRYFPDPDLPHLVLSEIPEFGQEHIRRGLPELPDARKARYALLGVKAADAEQFVQYPKLGSFFDQVIIALGSDASQIALASNYITNDLVRILRDVGTRDTEIRLPVTLQPHHFAELVGLVSTKKLTSRGAKDVLSAMTRDGGSAREVASKLGLMGTMSKDSLIAHVQEVISLNQKVVNDYRSGKEAALQFLIGQAMKRTKGASDPSVVKALLVEMILKS